MNKTLVTRSVFVVALVLLAAVNWIVLSQVATNRGGAPVSQMWLSERELSQVKWLALENSGVDLRINWRSLGGRGEHGTSSSPSWLRGKKLEELGFIFVDGRSAGEGLPDSGFEREVYLVLEYNGPAYHEALRRAERDLAVLIEQQGAGTAEKSSPTERYQARKRVRREQGELSRLFVVDAGTDPEALRASYADPNRYIISRGLIRLYYQQENKRFWAKGRIQGVHPAKIHLSLEQQRQLERFVRNKNQEKNGVYLPRYEVNVVYGKRYEPFIRKIRRIQASQQAEDVQEGRDE